MTKQATVHDARDPFRTAERVWAEMDTDVAYLTATASEVGSVTLNIWRYVDHESTALMLVDEILVSHGDAVWVEENLVRHLPAVWASGMRLLEEVEFVGANAAEVVVLIAETLNRSRGSLNAPPEVTGRQRWALLEICYRGSKIAEMAVGDIVSATPTSVTVHRFEES